MQHVIYEAVFIRLSKISAMTQQFIWLKTFSDQWYLSLRKPILNIWNRLGGVSGQKFMNGRILLFIIRYLKFFQFFLSFFSFWNPTSKSIFTKFGLDFRFFDMFVVGCSHHHTIAKQRHIILSQSDFCCVVLYASYY